MASESFWLLSPKAKFEQAWSEDVALLKAANKTNAADLLSRVHSIQVRSGGPGPVADWLEAVKPPITVNEQSGDLTLEILVVHQFSEPSTSAFQPQRYGTLVQYEFIDRKSGNKIAEFARTLWLGVYH